MTKVVKNTLLCLSALAAGLLQAETYSPPELRLNDNSFDAPSVQKSAPDGSLDYRFQSGLPIDRQISSTEEEDEEQADEEKGLRHRFQRAPSSINPTPSIDPQPEYWRYTQ